MLGRLLFISPCTAASNNFDPQDYDCLCEVYAQYFFKRDKLIREGREKDREKPLLSIRAQFQNFERRIVVEIDQAEGKWAGYAQKYFLPEVEKEAAKRSRHRRRRQNGSS